MKKKGLLSIFMLVACGIITASHEHSKAAKNPSSNGGIESFFLSDSPFTKDSILDQESTNQVTKAEAESKELRVNEVAKRKRSIDEKDLLLQKQIDTLPPKSNTNVPFQKNLESKGKFIQDLLDNLYSVKENIDNYDQMPSNKISPLNRRTSRNMESFGDHSVMHFGKRPDGLSTSDDFQTAQSEEDDSFDDDVSDEDYASNEQNYSDENFTDDTPEILQKRNPDPWNSHSVMHFGKKSSAPWSDHTVMHFGKRPADSWSDHSVMHFGKKSAAPWSDHSVMHFGKRPAAPWSDHSVMHFGKRPAAPWSDHSVLHFGKKSAAPWSDHSVMHFGKRSASPWPDHSVMHFGKREENPWNAHSVMHFGKRDENPWNAHSVMHFGKRDENPWNAHSVMHFGKKDESPWNTHSVMHFGKRGKDSWNAHSVMHFGKRGGEPWNEHSVMHFGKKDENPWNAHSVMHFGKRGKDAWNAHSVMHFGKKSDSVVDPSNLFLLDLSKTPLNSDEITENANDFPSSSTVFEEEKSKKEAFAPHTVMHFGKRLNNGSNLFLLSDSAKRSDSNWEDSSFMHFGKKDAWPAHNVMHFGKRAVDSMEPMHQLDLKKVGKRSLKISQILAKNSENAPHFAANLKHVMSGTAHLYKHSTSSQIEQQENNRETKNSESPMSPATAISSQKENSAAKMNSVSNINPVDNNISTNKNQINSLKSLKISEKQNVIKSNNDKSKPRVLHKREIGGYWVENWPADFVEDATLKGIKKGDPFSSHSVMHFGKRYDDYGPNHMVMHFGKKSYDNGPDHSVMHFGKRSDAPWSHSVMHFGKRQGDQRGVGNPEHSEILLPTMKELFSKAQQLENSIPSDYENQNIDETLMYPEDILEIDSEESADSSPQFRQKRGIDYDFQIKRYWRAPFKGPKSMIYPHAWLATQIQRSTIPVDFLHSQMPILEARMAEKKEMPMNSIMHFG